MNCLTFLSIIICHPSWQRKIVNSELRIMRAKVLSSDGGVEYVVPNLPLPSHFSKTPPKKYPTLRYIPQPWSSYTRSVVYATPSAFKVSNLVCVFPFKGLHNFIVKACIRHAYITIHGNHVLLLSITDF